MMSRRATCSTRRGGLAGLLAALLLPLWVVPAAAQPKDAAEPKDEQGQGDKGDVSTDTSPVLRQPQGTAGSTADASTQEKAKAQEGGGGELRTGSEGGAAPHEARPDRPIRPQRPARPERFRR